VCEGANCSELSSGYVLLVSLPTDSPFAPGITYAVPIDQLFSESPATSGCETPSCASLPNFDVVSGYYSVTLQEQHDLGWYLGNSQTETVIPAQATYRLLWPPEPEQNPCQTLAESMPLPIAPVTSRELLEAGLPPGPSDGGSVGFEAAMQPGCYELTLTPNPPFDEAFPPQVSHIAVAELEQGAGYPLLPDFTTLTSPDNQRTLPTFQVSRQAGLDGWKAFLRDTATLRPVSGVRPLQGTTVASLVLATSHVGQSIDALTGTELIIAPPAGVPIPTEHIPAADGVVYPSICYPPLPAPVAYNVTVTDDATGSPLEADLLFQTTAVDVYDADVPCVTPSASDAGLDAAAGDGAAPFPFRNTTNFEFATQGRTSADAGTDAASLNVSLPPGEYTVVVRPLDHAHSVASPSLVVVPSGSDAATQYTSFRVEPTVTVSGTVYVADGRPLNQASVVAIPQLCADSVPTIDTCLPRAASTTTGADGSYSLVLDRGTYALSIRPVDGTGLPWTVEPGVEVETGDPTVAVEPVYVPAPVHVNLRLVDPRANAIGGAIVRVFKVPEGPSAVPGGSFPLEVADSITDGGGYIDLVIAPTFP
jgi:hypothetical protein